MFIQRFNLPSYNGVCVRGWGGWVAFVYFALSDATVHHSTYQDWTFASCNDTNRASKSHLHLICKAVHSPSCIYFYQTSDCVFLIPFSLLQPKLHTAVKAEALKKIEPNLRLLNSGYHWTRFMSAFHSRNPRYRSTSTVCFLCTSVTPGAHAKRLVFERMTNT